MKLWTRAGGDVALLFFPGVVIIALFVGIYIGGNVKSRATLALISP